MPRRRMIDPDFWIDSRIKKLTPIERLFFIGMLSHADDEGRLSANSAYLRSIIFPYDDFGLEQIDAMLTNITQSNPNVQPYKNGDEQYIQFTKWARYQKPSHPQASKLPKPPQLQESFHEGTQESFHEDSRESLQSKDGIIPSQVRLGQSSLGKVSIGQGSSGKVPEDFTKFIDDNDLTDFLTKTLENYLPRGTIWLCAVLKELWWQCTKTEMPGTVYQLTSNAVKNYPPEVLGKAYVKAVRYTQGKTSQVNYLKAILEDKARSP